MARELSPFPFNRRNSPAPAKFLVVKTLSFLFLRYLSDNYETAAKKELGKDCPTTELDEATSHLDVNNESVVNEHIKQLDITRVIVAHRPETVRSAGRQINLAHHGDE